MVTERIRCLIGVGVRVRDFVGVTDLKCAFLEGIGRVNWLILRYLLLLGWLKVVVTLVDGVGYPHVGPADLLPLFILGLVGKMTLVGEV